VGWIFANGIVWGGIRGSFAPEKTFGLYFGFLTNLFQFLVVQLKVTNGKRKLATSHVSIPCGSIKRK